MAKGDNSEELWGMASDYNELERQTLLYCEEVTALPQNEILRCLIYTIDHDFFWFFIRTKRNKLRVPSLCTIILI